MHGGRMSAHEDAAELAQDEISLVSPVLEESAHTSLLAAALRHATKLGQVDLEGPDALVDRRRVLVGAVAIAVQTTK